MTSENKKPKPELSETFTADAFLGQSEYKLPKTVTGIFLVAVNDLPVNYEVILRLKNPTKKNGTITLGKLKLPIDK